MKLKNLKNSALGRTFLKVISVGIAFLLWLYVFNSGPIEVEKKFSIVYVVPKGLALNSDITREVSVTFKGPRAFLFSPQSTNDKIFINLDSPIYKGRRQFDLAFRSEDIPTPLGVDILKIWPKDVRIVLTKKSTKSVEVVASLSGDYKSMFSVKSIQVGPKRVVIEGPVDIIRSIDKLHTVPIDLSLLKSDTEVFVPLNELDPRIHVHLSNENLAPVENVSLLVQFTPKKANLLLKNVEIHFSSEGDTLKRRNLIPSQKLVSLAVFALPEYEGNIDKKTIRVFADIPEGNTPSEHKIKLRANLPEGVHLLHIYPEYINVKIQ